MIKDDHKLLSDRLSKNISELPRGISHVHITRSHYGYQMKNQHKKQSRMGIFFYDYIQILSFSNI
jgi:hypothetical protein